ncbi:MAG: protein kinase [Cyanobacteria bacterium SZAS LIN-3]|nr:protein kinase [Cyanobacteria bacterium SZAS LIN-3]
MTNSADLPGVPGEFQPGQLVGGTYVVLDYLGRGAMGNVYHAKHAVLNAEYALKSLSGEKLSDVEWKRFQNEAQAIAIMNHPNVVTIYNFGLHEGSVPYYVMDLLHGIDLARKLKADGPLEIKDAARIFVEVCAGVSAAHKKGVVHRDIKPGNIFLLEKPGPKGETVKVVDFGVAKLTESKDPEIQFLTSVGDVVGTPFYMSPEQTMGLRVDSRSDIYSLGCTLFESLTGTLPFRGRNPTETMLLHQTDPPPSLNKASGGKEFPAALEYIIAAALAKQPAERFQTMDQFAQELRTFLVDEPAPVMSAANGVIRAPLVDSNVPVARTAAGVGKELPKKVVIPAVAAVLIAASSFAYWQSRMQANKPKPMALTEQLQKLGPAPQAKSAEATTSEQAIFNQQAKESESTGEFYPFQIVTVSLLLKKPFSRTVVENGKQIRCFDFPKDVVIGLISSDKMDAPVKAVGELKFDINEQLTFTPTEVVSRAPNCLKRFRAGDIYRLKFRPKTDNDKIFGATKNIPGVKVIDFTGCWGLTSNALEIFRAFQGIRELDASYSNIDGTLIAQCYNWDKLDRLMLARGHNVQTMLDNLEEAKLLRYLCLSSTKMNRKELESLADLTQVTHLDLDNNHLSNDDLEILTHMKNLVELHVRGSGLDASAIPILKKFKHLQVLCIKSDRLGEEQIQKIAAAFPSLRIE